MRFVQGHDRTQASLLQASLEDYVNADNPARVIEAFVEALDLGAFGFAIIRRRC
jgi:transposase